MGSSWVTQLSATVRRNARIKMRDASQTLQEVLLPVYIIALLIIVKVVQPEADLPPVPMEPEVSLVCARTLDGSLAQCGVAGAANRATTLGYLPDHPATAAVMERAAHILLTEYPSLPVLSLRAFSSEYELQQFFFGSPEELFAAVDFGSLPSGPSMPPEAHFTIRINGSKVPVTVGSSIANKEECRPDTIPPTACQSRKYLTSGFLALQLAVSRSLMASAWSGSSACAAQKQSMEVTVRQMPLPALHRSFATVQFQLFTAMYLVWALIPLLQVAVSQIVHEKEGLLKDCMLLMGLRESVYWGGWLITYAIIAATTSFVIALSAKLFTLFSASSIVAIFSIIFPYSLSLIALAFALSTLFTEVNSAAATAAVLMLVGSALILPVSLLTLPPALIYSLMLFSPVPLTIAISIVTRAEGLGTGVHLNFFWWPELGVNPGGAADVVTVGTCVAFFFIDTALYLLIAWYLDNVWPHPERGPKMPATFVFSRAYWFPTSFAKRYSFLEQVDEMGDDGDESARVDMVLDSANQAQAASDPSSPSSATMEEVRGLRPALVLQDLFKRYAPRSSFFSLFSFRGSTTGRRGSRARRGLGRSGSSGRLGEGREAGATVGLHPLSITLYEGQTFAFLGHAGSGKSTIISLLAGLQQPTSGEAFLYGFSLTRSDSYIHSLIGYCPQHNIHISVLTVREQLTFFAEIKGQVDHLSESPGGGADRDDVAAGDTVTSLSMVGAHSRRAPSRSQRIRLEVQGMMEEMGLQGWADRPAYELSPSQQRKLTLCIALLGDPQVLLLDEPTRGMDASSRRQVWDLLSRRKSGRVLVFSTHSMEEADGVADRKAILSHGRLKCCGSSLFLRNRFGLSYLLHITKGTVFKASSLVQLLQSHVKSVTLLPSSSSPSSHSSDTVTYCLPVNAAPLLPALLRDLDSKSSLLGIEGASLEATTLEEVFLRFQDEDEDEAAAMMLPYSPATGLLASSRNTAAQSGLRVDSEDDSILLLSDAEAGGSMAAGSSSSASIGGGGGSIPGGLAGVAGGGVPVGVNGAVQGATLSSSSGADAAFSDQREGGGQGGVAEGAGGGFGVKHQASFRRQMDAVMQLRAAAYSRNPASTLCTFGLPMLFVLAALIVQQLATVVSSPDLLLYNPHLGNDEVIIYSVPDSPQAATSAQALLESLGPNHAKLDATNLLLRFEEDPANALPEGAGTKAVGIQFEELDLQACRTKFTILFQPWRVHQLPSVLAMLSNAFLKQVLSEHALTAAYPSSLFVHTYPLHFTLLSNVLVYFVAAVLSIALLLVPPVLGAQIVLERELGLQPLLRVSGLRGAPMWAATLAVDCLAFFVTACAITAIGLIFHLPPFTFYTLPILLLTFALAIPPLILLSYVLSFSFDNAQLTASSLSITFLLMAVIPFVFNLSVFSPSSFLLPHALMCVLSPPYALMSSLHFIAAQFSHDPMPTGAPDSQPLSASDYYAVHSPAVPLAIALLSMVASSLILLLRLRQLHAQQYDPDLVAGDLSAMMGPQAEEEDSDLERERERVQGSAAKWDAEAPAGGEEGDLVLCSSLGKNYGASAGVCGIGRDGGVWGVSNFWLGVPRGQVVVVLGGDRAGKSTLLQCVAGALPLSYGDALLAGSSVRFAASSSTARNPSLLGFCPQANVLFPFLTVREYLRLIAVFKGLREPVEDAVDAVLQSLQCTALEADSRISHCRSATLRRLGVAAALLGDPAILLLDDPTQGMDVRSRRAVWARLLSDSSRRATLVTTHSVEEAEALGSRVGVLVKGQLRAIGSPAALKAKYGSAYSLTLSSPPSHLPAIRDFLTSLIPATCELTEEELPAHTGPTLTQPLTSSGAAAGGSSSGTVSSSAAADATSAPASIPAAVFASAPAAATSHHHHAFNDGLQMVELSLSEDRTSNTASATISPAEATPAAGTEASSVEVASESAGPNVQAKFAVPLAGLAELARFLGELEGHKVELGIVEYNISQPTLQHVFHTLTRGYR